ncbi:DUF1707 SHOCT-like domain-containing protein [Raineyella fluvialis]|uniref:DUF1707 domain-containing protein n=1 Tax=Raineyella fluvialis TaxID=2662261 RepID=A0A5Q2FCP7_9ACTN|nr:DUF1707 domain-containing protein [Raineyella fluvialis]QGF22863.1 DUF1707 domain-containing protein [Raineyella fluvialis]
MTSDPGSGDAQRPLPRIGDAERQAAVDELSEHYVAGRLDDAEFNERMDSALQARTIPDLIPLFADLPTLNPLAPWSQPTQPPPLSAYGPPALPRRPGTDLTAAGPTEQGWMSLVRGLRPIIWPIAIALIIFAHVPAPLVIFLAIVLTVASSRMLGSTRHQELPPGPQGPGPGPGDRPSGDPPNRS